MKKKKLPEINALFDLDQVVAAMNLHCPSSPKSRGKSYKEIATIYRKLVIEQVQLKSRDLEQHRFNLFNLALDQIRDKMGRYTVNGKKLYWRYWFDIQPFSLYTIISKGNNMEERNSVVKLNFDLTSANELISWTPEMILAHYPVEGHIWETKIDKNSLNAYIKSTEAALAHGSYDTKSGVFTALNRNQKNTYSENLKTARAIEILSSKTGILQQGFTVSDFGRFYFNGINLQNCHRTLRYAALGDCHGYDMVSANQAWRMNECQRIKPDIYPYTKELLNNKMLFRRRVAGIIGINDMDKVKQVLTSIGFGADIESKPWPQGSDYELPALSKLLTDEQLTRLQLSPWFMGFVKEQHEMNDAIFEDFKTNVAKENYPNCILDSAKRLNRNKCLAYIYQQAESSILLAIMEYIKQHYDFSDLLLIVHDGFYMRNSIDMSALQGLVQSFNPYLKIEHTAHNAYTFEDVFGLLNHRQRIKEEETQALRYTLNKLEHSGWNDAEYKSCHKLFAAIYDKMIDVSDMSLEEQTEYQRLYNLYYDTWLKEEVMGNRKWRQREEYQRFMSKATNIEFSDGNETSDGYYGG